MHSTSGNALPATASSGNPQTSNPQQPLHVPLTPFQPITHSPKVPVGPPPLKLNEDDLRPISNEGLLTDLTVDAVMGSLINKSTEVLCTPSSIGYWIVGGRYYYIGCGFITEESLLSAMHLINLYNVRNKKNTIGPLL